MLTLAAILLLWLLLCEQTLAWQELLELLLERLRRRGPLSPQVARFERGAQSLLLLGPDVGKRQRRHVGVGDRFEHHGPVGGEGLFPGSRDVLGLLDADAFHIQKLRVAGVRKVGQLLRSGEQGVAGLEALLPGDKGGRGCSGRARRAGGRPTAPSGSPR